MSSDVVGRIAAGEVVERPASVLKELVENSIDAAASQIRINIEMGGHRLIQVIDNGCGMDRSDAALCLETHATSKICTSGDVGQIATLGFRGEAIPSIASVSRFNLQTCRVDEQVGTEVVVDFGLIRDIRDCGCAHGTNIRVAHLFGNMPARKKFLRGPETEDGYIEEMVRLLALSRPELSMVLTLNGREAIRVAGTSQLGERISSLLGKEFYASMLPLDYSESGITVRGFVSKPGFTRSSRRDQRIIVNGRAASADTIYFAIRDAFDSIVMKGRYPCAVIYVDLHPELVDVNVHPTKREVRFREPRLVSQVVAAALRRALRGMPGGIEIAADQPLIGQGIPEVALPPQRISEIDFTKPVAPPVPDEQVPAAGVLSSPDAGVKANLSKNEEAHEVKWAGAQKPLPPIQGALSLNLPPVQTPADQVAGMPVGESHPIAQSKSEAPPAGRGALAGLRFIGRLGKQYAVAESPNGLVLVKLQAAHQRIVFERLLKGLQAAEIPKQQLLIPTHLNLGPDDARFLKNELAYFTQLGFSIEPFGGNSFIVSGVPALFSNQDVGRMVRDIIDELRSSTVTNRQSVIHLAQVACRHAISSTANPSDEEVRAILKALAEADMPYVCPNGHPTMIHITHSELNKRFS